MLSIKPEYVERILSGEKTYEFRRRIFRRDDIDTIVIYSTSPQCAVIGEARIDRILVSSPERLWDETHASGGISRERFMDYFHDAKVAYAIKIKHVDPFKKPKPLTDYAPRVKCAPQSFVYVD
jgi:predicted transcriptional regulator